MHPRQNQHEQQQITLKIKIKHMMETNKRQKQIRFFLYAGVAGDVVPKYVTHVWVNSSVSFIQERAFVNCHDLEKVQLF